MVVKKKMGRPTLDGKSQNVRVQLRMDRDTLNKLDDLAKKKGMNRSEFIRQLIKNL